MSLDKDQLQFDASEFADSDQVASHLYFSDGTAAAHTGGAMHISDGGSTLSIDDGGGSITVDGSVTVSAIDLDIRDLANTQDSIAIGDETNIVDLEQNDAAFAGGYGFSMYGVRQDAGGSPVSADGDAHPFVFNSDGELKVAADLTSDVADDAADSGNPLKMGGRAFDGALTAVSASNDRYDMLGDMYRRTWVNDAPNVSNQRSREQVSTTAAEIAATPLAGRKRIMVQNRGTRAVYLGEDNTVTADDAATGGIRVARGATLELPWGEDLDIFAIAPAGTQNLFIWEIA